MFEPCAGWNEEFLAAHPESHLAACRDMMHARDPERFVITCCEITAHAILWKLGIANAEPAKCATFREAEARAATFLVDFNENEHFLVVHDGALYQSYYKQYSVRKTPITDAIRDAFDASPVDLRAIVGFDAAWDGVCTPEFYFPTDTRSANTQ